MLSTHDSSDQPSNVEVAGNTFEDNEENDIFTSGYGTFTGEEFDADEINLNQNEILGSGLNHTGEKDLDATNNFWGAASGPDGEGQGDGASVSENVDFTPWLLEADGETYDRTVSLATGNEWDAVSSGVPVEGIDLAYDGEVKELDDSEATVISYEGQENTWASVSSPSMLTGMFVQGGDALGIDEDEEPETITRDLEEGWNLVGAYEENSVFNQFSPVADSLNSVVSPDRNVFADGLSPGSTFNFENTDEGDENKASAFWLRVSESATLSTTPSPEGEE